MLDVILIPARFALAVAALSATPYLLLRCALPQLSTAMLLALAGAMAMAINTLVPLTLHLLALPLTPLSLASVHAALLLGATVALRLRRIRVVPEDAPSLRVVFLLVLAGILLAVPITPLAGIDTYKWQDLATVVQREGFIPWLIHPAGLFGFAPRAYPSAQPLTLATVQAVGGLGVESGYFLVSCLSLTTAVFAAYRLGTALFTPRLALLLAALYAFAPAAIRYHHWATGRGFFLAILPLLIIGLIGRTWRHAALAACAAALLLLTHKTAIVAIPVLTIGLMLVPGLRRTWRIPLALASAAAVLIVAGGTLTPSVTGFLSALRFAATRLGVLAPLILLAVFLPDRRQHERTPEYSQESVRSRIVTLLLLLLPIAFTSDMYGTLLLLPLAAIAATHGLSSVSAIWPATSRAITTTVVAMLAVGALAIVINRDMSATPRRIREAALWLDAYDHFGTFRIVAPDGLQGRMQAYVAGCPRFNVFRAESGGTARIKPSIPFSSPRAFVTAMTAYMRNVFEPQDLETDWYGGSETVYHVLLDGKGEVPQQSELIYEKNGVKIFQVREVSAVRKDRESR